MSQETTARTGPTGPVSAGHLRLDAAAAQAEDAGWKTIYRTAAAAALLVVTFVPIQIAVFIAYPPPTTVIGWFTLFQSNRLIGLLDMDLLLIVDQVLMGLVLLALYVALRRFSPSLTTIALAAGFLGIAAYFSSGTAFNMLALSDQYAATATEAERAVVLAAGQAMLSIWMGTAFDLGYVLLGAALLIVAAVMLRGGPFGRVTAYVGIVLGLMSLLPPTAGTVGLVFSLGSLVPLEIWLILVARRLLQLGQEAS